jgi:hypothetical protein
LMRAKLASAAPGVTNKGVRRPLFVRLPAAGLSLALLLSSRQFLLLLFFAFLLSRVCG